MKNSIFILLSSFLLINAQAQTDKTPPATPPDPAHCEALLNEAKATLLADEEVLLEEMETVISEELAAPQGLTVEFLTDLVVPEFYQRDSAAFAEARKEVIANLMRHLKQVRGEMAQINQSSIMTATQMLDQMGRRFDAAGDTAEKTAILTYMLSQFSISNENEYISYVGNSSASLELKRALYKGLSKIFKNDPTWQYPLEKAILGTRIKSLFGGS